MTAISGPTSVVDHREGRVSKVIRALFAATLAICSLIPMANAEQKSPSATAPLIVESMYGPDLYRHYCATCHGRDGKGKGPAAAALKVPPPDLTVLARRRNGVFPGSDVESIIRGGAAVTAHGSEEMPVWGPIFYALDPSDARVKARIDILVAHIASIQRP
jgi:mono/diheme cytochrome c family protein